MRTLFFVLLLIIAIGNLIGFLRLGGRVIYSEEGIKVKARVGLIRVTVFPWPFKKKKKEGAASSKKETVLDKIKKKMLGVFGGIQVRIQGVINRLPFFKKKQKPVVVEVPKKTEAPKTEEPPKAAEEKKEPEPAPTEEPVEPEPETPTVEEAPKAEETPAEKPKEAPKAEPAQAPKAEQPKEPKKEEKPEKKKKSEADEEKPGKGGMVKELLALLPDAFNLLGGTVKKLQIDQLTLFYTIAGRKDAAGAAMQYGAVYATGGTVFSVLEHYLTIKKARVDAEVDFNADEPRIYAVAELSFTVGQLVRIGLHALLIYLDFNKIRKKYL